MKTIKEDYAKYSPELLSKAVDIMSLAEDNNLLKLLVEKVAMIPLNTIGCDRLSISALQFLLSYTHEKEKPFEPPEYVMKLLPTLKTNRKFDSN